MKKTGKHTLLIVGIILVVLAVLGTIGFRALVNTLFSKVTQSIGETNILQNESGKLILPKLSEDGSRISENESVTVELDADSLNALEEKISVQDKFQVLAILANALPREEYEKILAYSVDGISQEEFSECYAIMKKNLTDEQKEQIKQYYAKYLHLLE